MVGAPVSQRRTKTLRTVKRRRRVVTYVEVARQVTQCERPYVLFGEAVMNARHELYWTQQELADKMGLSRGSIANIETGRQRVLLTDVLDFAKKLKLNPQELFAACLK